MAKVTVTIIIYEWFRKLESRGSRLVVLISPPHRSHLPQGRTRSFNTLWSTVPHIIRSIRVHDQLFLRFCYGENLEPSRQPPFVAAGKDVNYNVSTGNGSHHNLHYALLRMCYFMALLLSFLSIYVPIYLFIHLFIYLSIHQSVFSSQ